MVKKDELKLTNFTITIILCVLTIGIEWGIVTGKLSAHESSHQSHEVIAKERVELIRKDRESVLNAIKGLDVYLKEINTRLSRLEGKFDK